MTFTCVVGYGDWNVEYHEEEVTPIVYLKDDHALAGSFGTKRRRTGERPKNSLSGPRNTRTR